MVVSKMEFEILPSQIEELKGFLARAMGAVKGIRGLEKWVVARNKENTYMSMAFYRDRDYVSGGIPVLMELLKELTPHVENISDRKLYDVVLMEKLI